MCCFKVKKLYPSKVGEEGKFILLSGISVVNMGISIFMVGVQTGSIKKVTVKKKKVGICGYLKKIFEHQNCKVETVYVAYLLSA